MSGSQLREAKQSKPLRADGSLWNQESQWESDKDLKARGTGDVRARTAAVAKPVAAAHAAWHLLDGASHSMPPQGHGPKDIGQDRQLSKQPTQATAAGHKEHMSAQPEQASAVKCLPVEKRSRGQSRVKTAGGRPWVATEMSGSQLREAKQSKPLRADGR